jgi:RecG-like helicase
MRGTANADLAAFHKVDARSAGFHAHVAAASQDGFHLALDDLDAHGSGDTNGFAFNDAHRIGKWFIGRAAAAAISAAQRMARQAAESLPRRRRAIKLEKVVTR